MRATSLRRKTGFLVLICSLWFCVAWPTFALPQKHPLYQEAAVQPESFSMDLNVGESAVQEITITTSPTPIPKVDVLFLFDVTSSMGEELAHAKDRGVFIMDSLIANVPDAAFGVASFADYPDEYDFASYAARYGDAIDYPWSLDVDITSDTVLVQQGIEALSLHSGEDLPEAYSRALFESIFVNWRSGTKRVIVLFGDAPAHDPTFYLSSSDGQNFGVDPGRDGIAGTADDLSFTDVVAQLSDSGIQVLPVNSDQYDYSFVLSGFEYIADQTGGQVYSLMRADELPELVAAGLEQATSNISTMAITAEDAYSEWVAVDPPFWNDVGGGEIRQFTVTITPPDDAPSGRHTIELQVTGDAALLGQSTATVNVGSSFFDSEAIRNEKYQLIEQLSAPSFSATFFDFQTTWSPAIENTYALEEQNVKVWLDSLDWNNLSTAQLAATYRLTSQEDALLALLYAQDEAGQIGNNQLGHVTGIIWSAITASDHLDSANEDTENANVVTSRLQQQVKLKLLQELTSAIYWSSTLLPKDDALTSSFQNEANTIGQQFAGKMAEVTRSGPITDENYRRLLFEELILPLNRLSNELYVAETRQLIPQGLANAQEMASGSAPSDSGAQTELVDEIITEEVTSYQATVQTVQSNYETSAFSSRAPAEMAELTELLSGALSSANAQLSPQEMERIVQLVDDVTDAYYQTPAGYTAYGTWWTGTDVADETSSAAFMPPASSVALLQMMYRYESKDEAIAAKSAIIPDLSEFTLALETQVEEDADAFEEILNQIPGLVSNGDDEGILVLLEELLFADDKLNQSMQAANLPVVSGSRSALSTSSADFAPVYSDFGRSASAFNTANASLYLSILDWLVRPTSAEEQQRVLERIEVVKNDIAGYRGNLATTLPYVEAAAAQPSVLIADFSLPEIQMGREAQLELELWNPSPNRAENVLLSIDPGSTAQVVSASPVAVGTVASEKRTPITVSFIPEAETGFLTLITTTDNGAGSTRIVPFSVKPAEPSVVGGGVGPWTWFFAGIAAAVAIGLMLFTRRTSSPPAMSISGPQLTLLSGDAQPEELLLGNQQLILGREADCDIVITDELVSRKHARIYRAQNTFYLEDLKSLNGTFVNQVDVIVKQLIQGDMITIGGTTLYFS